MNANPQGAKVTPPARAGYALAYDQQRKRAVLFGGYQGDDVLFADTWEWDGTQWQQQDASGPTPRAWPVMVFDAAQACCILFGGKDMAQNNFGDTWQWDGQRWTELTVSGPSARSHLAMAYDTARQKIVLFGGNNKDIIYDDTWEWNGQNWQEIAVAGPKPALRAAHAMYYDEAHQQVRLFGGVAENNKDRLGDLWGWDGAHWHQIDVAARPRALPGVVYDPTQAHMLLLGGWTQGFDAVTDGWTLNEQGWTPFNEPGPSARSGHMMVFDASRKRILLFGGADENFDVMDDTWEWDGANWRLK